MELQKNRQIRFAVLFFAVALTATSLLAQPQKSTVDYSQKSNILNPDTLRGDQKKIFWHFVKLNSDQVEKLEPQKVKTELEEIGITTKEGTRFGRACIFFTTTMKNHKKSCEQWESFKDLAPKSSVK